MSETKKEIVPFEEDYIKINGELFPPTTAKEPEFGSRKYFTQKYNDKINCFLTDFLEAEVKSIIQKDYEDKEEMRDHLVSLTEVYYEVRTEFEKHSSKLKSY